MPAPTELRISIALTLALAALASGPSPVHAQTTSGVVIVPVPAPAPVVTPSPPAQVYVPAPSAYTAQGQPYAVAPRERSGPSLGLVISGAVLLGVGWVLDFIVGVFAGTDPFSSHSSDAWDTFRGVSFVPIAGPWLQLAYKPTGFNDDLWGAWLLIDGLLQGAGTILLISGLATMGGDDSRASTDGGVQWALMPMLGPDRAGVSVVGAF